jgi:CRISPR/Cas system-associated exonuclease Cas4 (RecB family)
MRKIGTIQYKKIRRISPSQYTSMKACAYKSLLAEAFDKVPPLPVSPSAYLATVLHKMLELIAKSEITNEVELKQCFEVEVLNMENYLKSNGYDFLVPLQMNVRDFGIKKIQLKKHLRSESEPQGRRGPVKYTTEKWLESKDRMVGGKADLVTQTENKSTIVDFKTGKITEDVLDDYGEAYTTIRPEYQEQLKLYAYLFFENHGRFPEQLFLVDLAKQKFSVDFTEEECKRLFAEARRLLLDTNQSIDSGIFPASPNEVNCKYCLYRPACSFYLAELSRDNSFNDVCGLVTDAAKYQNGNVSAFVFMGGNANTITGFAGDKYQLLKDAIGKQIGFFNLRREATPFFYSATRSTAIYEQ